MFAFLKFSGLQSNSLYLLSLNEGKAVFKGATSWMAHLEKIGNFFQVCRSSCPSSTILVPVWFIITSLVFFYLSKQIFRGLLQFKGDFSLRKNDLKYRDIAPLRKPSSKSHIRISSCLNVVYYSKNPQVRTCIFPS